ncbi:hypothetical protein SLUN_17520 [Streptomyces lunaelactis]|uniref:Thioredoxin-like fold domain-containing protein n=2 Tax=Streptomyces lunaelactis TaxID=1535768 RepID=A0A2R4TEF3_9ACTN|nr:hypothetical protein SLUN_17520 [Streptomyces lunaelactis]NUK86471.1 thioredoxin domain-containing protein [Streptomyces lunaelactis]
MQVRRGAWLVPVALAMLGLSVSACTNPRAKEPISQRSTMARSAYTSADELPEKLSEDGTTIVVGDPQAPMVVRLYEDMRCPVCEEFELQGSSTDLRGLTLKREVRTEYVLASFLDDRVGGNGSKKAANALRAALAQGKFAQYHAVLFANQPEEVVDGYNDEFLLRMASQVPGLRGPAFDSSVKEMKYAAFVTAAQKSYHASAGNRGTPSMDVNGRPVPDDERGVFFVRGWLETYLDSYES